jgi:Methylamine utilization protein MauJ
MTWLLVLAGIGDAYLWWFDTDGWKLAHGDPARGTLGVLPLTRGGTKATIDDAMWLADVIAFDHDAPVGIRPAVHGPGTAPIDPDGIPEVQPVHPYSDDSVMWHWDNIGLALGAAAEQRFNDSYILRYDDDPQSPSRDFSARFAGREHLVSMYAMAARQADPLSEYLCLYRILEAADGANGMRYAAKALPALLTHDYGDLRVATYVPMAQQETTRVFELYKYRAKMELASLQAKGFENVPRYLYGIRNKLAHGGRNVLTADFGSGYSAAQQALPIVKLMARMAVEPSRKKRDGSVAA